MEERSSEEDTGTLFGNNRSKVKANKTVVLLVQLGQIKTDKIG
jgi:hypothetical protein